MNPLTHILEHQIVAIIRGVDPKDMLKIVDALERGGIKTLEITLNSPKALDLISEITDKLGDKLLIGAGTVLDAESARTAMLAGARFIVSPSLNLKTIQMTKRYGGISIPGAFTPTEILMAYESGGDLIKVFPASVGAAYLNEIRGPLSYIPLLPTGGINLQNITEFKKAGAAGFGLGSSLVHTDREITESYLNALTENARRFVEAVKD